MKQQIKEQITRLTRLIVSPRTEPVQREIYKTQRTVLKSMLNNDDTIQGMFDALEEISLTVLSQYQEIKRLKNKVNTLTPKKELKPSDYGWNDLGRNNANG